MDRKLLVAAALGVACLISAPPAAARHLDGSAHPVHRDRGDHRFHRGVDGSGVVWGAYDLQSSYDDRDWTPESGNGWWHDRPDRAFPRWVQEQHARGTCDPDRMWWSGSGWHC